jgi:glucan phosphoethanolaminetransferase (alkaline phosphatase superfamily)
MLKTSSAGRTGQSAVADFEKRLTGRVPDDADVPGPVRKGVRFMLAGAALTALVGIFLLIATIVDKNALTDSSGKKLSSAEFTSNVVGTAITYLILVVIWVLMARMNRSGHNWARILASVFCAISTYDAYSLVNSLKGGTTITVAGIVYIVFTLALWVVGVIAIALIWRSESSAYYRARSAAPR